MNPNYLKPTIVEVFNKEYYSNTPYPHITLDNFWNEDELNRAVDELEALDENIWYKNRLLDAADSSVQQKKSALNKISMLEGKAPTLEKIMTFLNSQEFMKWLSDITFTNELISDPHGPGAGSHRTKS